MEHSATLNCLWIDNNLPIPSEYGCEWTSARSFHEAIFKLELMEFEVVSFGYSLGSVYGSIELTGYHIALWLAQQKLNGFPIPSSFHVHSTVPDGQPSIQHIIDNNLLK